MMFSLEGYMNYLLWMAPALLLAMWAQWKVRGTYAAAAEVPARLSGAAAARHILDSAGLQNVAIEPIAGQLTDHYDPSAKGVYGSRSAAAVGIAAHEAGHALQDAHRYAPLVIRNLAVPAANFGGSIGMLLLMVGVGMAYQGIAAGGPLIILGIIGFACVAAFQLINLPVEFDASNRAKQLLVSHGIVGNQEMVYVNSVLNAAAWTYVAATLQSVLTVLYYVMHFTGGGRDE
jgi:uncharacterized protein